MGVVGTMETSLTCDDNSQLTGIDSSDRVNSSVVVGVDQGIGWEKLALRTL